MHFVCILSLCQPHRMVKDTQAIRLQQPTNCLSIFDHFVGLALKGLCWIISPFHTTVLILYPLKTLKNRFSDVFRGYRKTPLTWNVLKCRQAKQISLYFLMSTHKDIYAVTCDTVTKGNRNQMFSWFTNKMTPCHLGKQHILLKCSFK